MLSSGLFSAVLALASGACGGDDDSDDTDDTADGPDAAGDGILDAGESDAAAPTLLRLGTMAITDTVVTNPIGKIPIRGGVVDVSFVDVTTATVPPVEGFGQALNGCLITVYDVKGGDAEPETVGEGSVTVSGTANGEFACIPEGGRYMCQSTDPDLAGGTEGNAAGGTLDPDTDFLIVGGAHFGPKMEGMWIGLTGFGTQDGLYPIISVLDEEILQLPTGSIEEEVNAGETATFTTFVGREPFVNEDGFAFLDDGATGASADIVINREGGAIVPSAERVFKARGEGMTLSGTQPHEFPFERPADDVIFECDGAGCGSDPDQVTGIVKVMVVSGRTTDNIPVVDDDGITMLDPVNSFATFQCSALVGDAVTIPAAGVDAILGTNPARIQVTVGRFAAVPEPSDEFNNNMLVGHSLTGYTTAPID
jgi:hypothetical protein